MGFYRGDSFHHHYLLRWVSVLAVSATVGSGVSMSMVHTAYGAAIPGGGTAATVNFSQPTVDNKTKELYEEGLPLPTSKPRTEVTVTDGITQVVKQVKPAVMGVVNYATVTDFFSQTAKLRPTGVGTGVLVLKNTGYGFAVTNNHVVEGASKVEVVLASGKHVQAQVVGTDPYTDLAVLKIPATAVQDVLPVRFANSEDIQTGETAIAIGTPLGLDFADSVTAGIVSASKRIMPVEDPGSQSTLDYQTVIQTDAAINPGNSGGPLLNINGEMIGINSSKIVAPNFEGMGFAIPSNEVKSIADQIIQNGHALHPALGITGESLISIPEQFWPDVPVDYGVWVKMVVAPETEKSGLQSQDVIVGIDDHPVKNMADLRTYLFQKKPGDVVKLDVYRGEQKLELKVKLGEMKSVNTTRMSSAPVDPLNPFGPGQLED